ncbi:MAG: nucleotidyltransferase family protein [Candidatus Saliniplasma sp.]
MEFFIYLDCSIKNRVKMKVKLGSNKELRELIEKNEERIIEFCKENHIKEISLFGSALRSDFTPDSDIDILVKFEGSHIPGYFDLIRMEEELSSILGQRKVDLRTPGDLSRYFRDSVMDDSEVIYEKR